MPNIFETLLTNITEADRQVFTEIADRNPTLKDYVADPKDIGRVKAVEEWYAGNWDFDHNCTKQEYARSLRITALETELAEAKANPGNDDMNLDQLNTFLDEKIKAGVVVSPTQVKEDLASAIKAKEDEFNQVLNSVATSATMANYLSQIHQRDFPGEILDPRDLFTKAAEAKATDLETFYTKTYAAEKYAAKQKAESEKSAADLEAKLKAARDEGRKAALQERVGETPQGSPSIEGSPEMGHFQAKILNMQKPKEGVAPIEAELGRGQIAAIRAREGDRAELMGNNAA